MWVRSAYWIGEIKPGREAEFARLLDGDLAPAMRRSPGVRGVQTLWPRRREDDPPQLACQVLVRFADRAGLDEMLASAERQALRPRVMRLREMFDGALSHIDLEVGPAPAGELSAPEVSG